MSQIPRDSHIDSSLALLSDGYRFISNRCRRYDTDIFETRLLLQRAICTMGEEAARMFYYPGRFTRVHAMPPTTLMLLQDKDSVQQLDGDAHRHRKQMFMSLMNQASIESLAQEMAQQWHIYIERWSAMDKVILHHGVREILCRAVCNWTGVPLAESEATRRTHEFGLMIDGAGAVGPKNWWALLRRTTTEQWAAVSIEQVRNHVLNPREGSALHVIAWHRQPNGTLLKPNVAAVELLNVLRPTVAVARYIVFIALALHEHPECRQRLYSGEHEYVGWFVHEVRRFYPFFPLIGGRVRQEFEWRGHHFGKGTWVLLDLYGTNHDERSWHAPQRFQPQRFQPRRFQQQDVYAYSFVPQGGGSYDSNHRCAGEWITIELMKTAVRMLTTCMRYEVPAQDLQIDMSKMPAIPRSRFVIQNVRRA